MATSEYGGLKRHFGVVHGLANCEDCGWQCENYINAQALAAKHAKKYGHKVLVEVGLNGYYDGRQGK